MSTALAIPHLPLIKPRRTAQLRRLCLVIEFPTAGNVDHWYPKTSEAPAITTLRQLVISMLTAAVNELSSPESVELLERDDCEISGDLVRAPRYRLSIDHSDHSFPRFSGSRNVYLFVTLYNAYLDYYARACGSNYGRFQNYACLE